MNRPGDRLRRLTTRVCSERNGRRLVDPAIADLQSEFATARRARSRWLALRALAAGYLSVAKVLIIASCSDLRHEARTWRPEERAVARRGVRVAIITTAAATAATIIYTLSKFTFHTDAPGWNPVTSELIMRAGLAVYLLPSTLALTVPLGLVLGTAWALRGAGRTGKLGAAVAVLAAVCSLGMFVNNVWLTPQASQAFRQIAIARFFHWDEDRPLARGANGLTLGERIVAARQFGLPRTPRYFEALYHKEVALTVAALPLVGIVLALVYRRRWDGGRLIVAGVVMFALYYAGLRSVAYANAIFGTPPVVAAWLPNASLAAVAMLLAATPVSSRYAR